MTKEIRMIKDILKILDNTITELTLLMRNIEVEDQDKAYKISIKKKDQ